MFNSVKNYNEQPLSTKEEWNSSLINNSPYVHDLLNKIEEVVSCNADPIGVTIALTGALGSGKSSIVKQTQSSLKPEYNCLELSENNSEESSGNDSAQQLVDAEFADSSSHNEGAPVARKIELKVSEFRCLWFQNDEALMLGFVEHLSAQISLINKDAGKKFLKIALPKLISGGLRVVQLASPFMGIPFLEKAVEAGIKLSEDIADSKKEANESSESIEELLSSLHEALEQKDAKESKKRILIVLDDLDRLDSTEVLAMFRLIKTFGNLPNIMFLLVYDNNIVSAIVEKHFPESKGKYLDKFIQFQIDVMPPKRVAIIEQLKNRVLCLIEKTREELKDASLSSYKILFEDIELSNEENGDSIIFTMLNLNDLIASYIKTPRELNLIAMATSCSWIKCNNLICLRDLIALEILKRYEKSHYRSLYDVTDEFDFKKDYLGLNKDKLQNTIVANSWHKGVTALSGSFENPCLMVLFINGYANYTVALRKMFIQTLKATSSEDTSAESVDFLVKAFILDLNETCNELFNGLPINKYQYVLSVATGISILDYYIDSAMILIKGELKHSEVFNCFLNALIDLLLEQSSASLAKKLAINKYELNAILFESLQSWMGRAVCDNQLLPSGNIYSLKYVLEKAKSTEPLMFIYRLFNGLTKHNYSLDYYEYKNCIYLFFKMLHNNIIKGYFFYQNHIYVILRDCKDCFLKIKNELNQYPAVDRANISLAILSFDIDKLKDDIVEGLRSQIKKDECALNFYLSCANYFNALCKSYHDDSEGNILDFKYLNHLSEEFGEFLNFYKLDPKMICQQLVKIKQDLIAKNETITASDIDILIRLINLEQEVF